MVKLQVGNSIGNNIHMKNEKFVKKSFWWYVLLKFVSRVKYYIGTSVICEVHWINIYFQLIMYINLKKKKKQQMTSMCKNVTAIYYNLNHFFMKRTLFSFLFYHIMFDIWFDLFYFVWFFTPLHIKKKKIKNE